MPQQCLGNLTVVERALEDFKALHYSIALGQITNLNEVPSISV